MRTSRFRPPAKTVRFQRRNPNGLWLIDSQAMGLAYDYGADPVYAAAGQLPAFSLRFESGSIVDVIGSVTPTFTRPASVKNVWNGSQFVQVAADVPAFQAHPVTGRLGYLHEPAATNLVPRSSNLNTLPWGRGANITATEGVGTLGVFTGTRVARNVSAASGNDTSISASWSAGTITASAIVGRGVLGNGFGLRIQPTFANRADAIFDLLNGTVVGTAVQGTATGASATMQRLLGDIYLCTLTATVAAGGLLVLAPTETTVSPQNATTVQITNSDCIVYHVQLEAGTAATSPIITAGSTSIRAADTMTVSGPNFSSWYNQLGGVVYWEGATFGPATSHGLVGFDDTTGNERYRLGHTGTSAGTFILVDNNVVQTPSMTTPVNQFLLGQVSKAAARVELNNCQLAVNGNALITDNSVTLPTVTQMTIGTATAVSSMIGPIYRIDYFAPGPAQSRIQQMTA